MLMIFSTMSHGDVTYCPEVKMTGKEIDFSDTERKLFCGDSSSHAWKNIPPYEAEQFIRGMLQSRGYLSPKFELEGNVLVVRKGRKSSVKRIRVIPESRNLSKKIKKDVQRLYRGRELTTSMLNSIEGEGMAQLRRRGYPCGKVSSEVNVLNDTVALIIDPRTKHHFGEINREHVTGLHENALLRFYPMEKDQRFDGDLLVLTEKRMSRAEVVQGTYFLENCSQDGKEFSLQQKFITGPPRTFRYGAGASTEAGPFVRARWANNREGKMASLLAATAELSLRNQSLNLTSDFFPWTEWPRESFYTQLEVTRESQFDYEQSLARLRPQYKWTTDIHQHGTIWIAGPAFESGKYQSQVESVTRNFSSALFEGSFLRTAHLYELFDVHPQDGDQLGITLSYRHPALGFLQSVTKLDTTFVKLGRIANSGRGAIVGGFRFKAGTAFTRDVKDLNKLPPEVKFFGGGSDDLRGYLLRTLPDNNGAGALSRIVSKFELRQTHFFHEKLEAFGFTDSGYFGRQSFSLDSRLWYSPGLGLRWLSPIGLIQAYWARALSLAPTEDSGNFFFAGLGGTF
jgi:translocation and assembly module TamA